MFRDSADCGKVASLMVCAPLDMPGTLPIYPWGRKPMMFTLGIDHTPCETKFDSTCIVENELYGVTLAIQDTYSTDMMNALQQELSLLVPGVSTSFWQPSDYGGGLVRVLAADDVEKGLSGLGSVILQGISWDKKNLSFRVVLRLCKFDKLGTVSPSRGGMPASLDMSYRNESAIPVNIFGQDSPIPEDFE